MLLIGLRAGISGSTLRKLNSIEKLDVRAVVEFIGVAGGWIPDQKADWAALIGSEWLVSDPIDDDALATDGIQRNRNVKIVSRGMKRQIVRLRFRANAAENRLEHHTVAATLGLKPRDVVHVIDFREPGKIS
jgi:hypothetical protein